MVNSTIKPSACKTCGSPYHSAMYHKLRKPIAAKPIEFKELSPCTICGSTWHYDAFCPKKSKRLAHGKVWKRWTKCKAEWFKLYGTDHLCHYCGVKLSADTSTLDHKTSRSRAPELRYDFNNLVPCCFTCNGLKGSVDHDTYKHNCPDTKKEATQ